MERISQERIDDIRSRLMFMQIPPTPQQVLHLIYEIESLHLERDLAICENQSRARSYAKLCEKHMPDMIWIVSRKGTLEKEPGEAYATFEIAEASIQDGLENYTITAIEFNKIYTLKD